jgi:threonine dehydrogenase-like Zn-dependent dehydrogenase
MVAKLRAGVVGAGVFGGYHAAKYAGMADCRLTAIFDPHPERAREMAERFGAHCCADLAELLGMVDVVSVASPAHTHAASALACLAAGKPVYVEKPIATSLEEADALIELIDGTVGMDRLRCMHLNDSQVDFGANKDRHENIGDGTIGADGLAALLGHPALQGIPAILEVPGEGDGPRTEDVVTARGVLEEGLALRA